MATPLTAMSKYGGVLMAVLCVMLMFAFVIGDPLMNYAGGGPSSGGRAGDTVITWRGGSMNEREMATAVRHRGVLSEFQQAVYRLGLESATEAGVEDFELRIAPLSLPRTAEEGVENDIVVSKLLARRARDAGMVVTDEMITDYFRALGRDRVSNDQMREVISQLRQPGGRSATIQFVFDLMREAMLAQRYLASYSYALRTILPEQSWEDWRKVNERLSIEVAPLNVDDFVDQVEDPSEEELLEYFQLYRNSLAGPVRVAGVELPSRTPGFATPQRVKLAYLRADFARELEAASAAVTDEEVAAYYEENKEQFVAADRALFGDESLFGPADGEGDTPAADEPMQEEPSADEPTDDESEGDKPSEDAADASDEPSADSAAPATEEPTEEPTEPPSDETSGEPSEPGDTPEASEEEEEEESASDADEDGDIPYQSLEEVSEDIRETLAARRAMEQIGQRLSAASAKLDDAFYKYLDKKIVADEDPDAEAPEPPESLTNLQPIAEEFQLELSEVDQASILELRETEVGRSIDTASPVGAAPPLYATVFAPNVLELYEPTTTVGLSGDGYLTLIVERYPAGTPELEDVRDQVIRAWKREKAADLALEAAKKLAEQATESGKTLSQFLADAEDTRGLTSDDVVETAAFTLLQFGPMSPAGEQVRLELSQPAPLKAAGPELLQSVFELDAGQVGAELNFDRSVAYLLRVAQKIGTEDELRREYLRAGSNWLGRQPLYSQRASQVQSALFADLQEQFGAEWQRTPDR